MDLGLGGIFEELTFAVASFSTLLTAGLYSQCKSIARNLERAPVLTVGKDLQKEMKEKSNLNYAIVTGRVFPMESEKTLNSISGMPAVISKLNVKELRWVDTFTRVMVASKLDYDGRISPSLNYVPFALSNPNDATTKPSPNTYVMVDDVSNAQFDNLLLTAKSTYVPTQATLTGLLLSFFRGFHSVGVETAESVLPVGTVITVIGEITKLSGTEGHGFRVAKSSAGGQSTPYILTTKNILEVKSDMRAQAMAYKVLSFLCGCFTIMTFYALGKKWLPRLRMRRVQRMVQIDRQRNRSSTEGLHETQICLACLQNRRDVALLPCGHICVCADCSLRIDERCPVCREAVVETVPVYIA